MKGPVLPALIVVMVALVTWLDVGSSAELVGSILFTLPVSLCALHRSRWLVWGTAVTASLLTFVAGEWGLGRAGLEQPWVALVNRSLVVASLFTLAVFVQLRINKREQMLQMEGRYRGLLEAAPDAMVLVSMTGVVVLVNIETERHFGYAREEIVGQLLKTIIPDTSTILPEVRQRILDAAASKHDAVGDEIGAAVELRGVRKDGSQFPIEIRMSILHGGEGPLVTVAIRDVTARKEVDARLLETVAELNRSNEELGQFAYIASHDLQEPLRMVASYTQLLSRRYKGKLDSDADEFIAFAVDGANRMQGLIQDLLSYSRVGTAGSPLTDTSSEKALEQAMANLAGAIEDSGALVTHGQLPTVRADAGQLVQLFQNLVGNAIKYQRPGIPQVHISSARTTTGGPKWMFSVHDNGLGIEPEHFERIFGMFQRLHGREEFAGTGIGLAICKKIVERHGGDISVESRPGEGSTFHFALTESQSS